jgi:hypothetical protein
LSSLAPYRAPPIGQVPKPMTDVHMSDAPKHRVFMSNEFLSWSDLVERGCVLQT